MLLDAQVVDIRVMDIAGSVKRSFGEFFFVAFRENVFPRQWRLLHKSQRQERVSW